MERRCEEPHCLQMVPEYLFQIHQDYHVAERLAAEEAEQQQTQHFGANADAAAEAVTIAQNGDTEDSDYQFALALNREYREEEEQHFFRQMQVRSLTTGRHSLTSETGSRCRKPGGRGTSNQKPQNR